MCNKTLEQYISNVGISFDEEVEDTFVVSVTVDDTNFKVNCQYGVTHDYKESNELDCCNESGGDYYDSGLNEYIEEHYELDADKVNKLLQQAIESCASKQVINTAEAYLFAETNLKVKINSEDTLFGACHAYNCSLRRYDEIDGDRVIITSEDSDEQRIQKSINKFRVFESLKEYSGWSDAQYVGGENEQHLHFGDCGLALRAYNTL